MIIGFLILRLCIFNYLRISTRKNKSISDDLQLSTKEFS